MYNSNEKYSDRQGIDGRFRPADLENRNDYIRFVGGE